MDMGSYLSMSSQRVTATGWDEGNTWRRFVIRNRQYSLCSLKPSLSISYIRKKQNKMNVIHLQGRATMSQSSCQIKIYSKNVQEEERWLWWINILAYHLSMYSWWVPFCVNGLKEFEEGRITHSLWPMVAAVALPKSRKMGLGLQWGKA